MLFQDVECIGPAIADRGTLGSNDRETLPRAVTQAGPSCCCLWNCQTGIFLSDHAECSQILGYVVTI